MRCLLPLGVALVTLISPLAHAGQLEIAVIEFPDTKSADELQAAFSKVDLAEISDGDRTRTKEADLKGGYILFSQSIPLAPGNNFSSSTRIALSRADVQGTLSSSSISLNVSISEGVQAGLRRFSKRVYQGSGHFQPGIIQVLSIRQIESRKQIVLKDHQEERVLHSTIALVSCYRR